MRPSVLPFSLSLTPEALHSFLAAKQSNRRLSNLKDYFLDRKAAESILTKDDPVIYEFWEIEYDATGRGLSFGMTRIFPGVVGKEFYQTRGHFHTDGDGDEIYVVLSGRGVLLLYSKDGQCVTTDMLPGKMCYIPGYMAHRAINVGKEDLVFFSTWPPKIDHDYATIAQYGFPKLVVAGSTGVEVINNPAFNGS
jgi:glucose-6-phosphate isomerase